MHPILFLVDNMMLPLLKLFYNLSHNYAVAIILLTIAVKIIFYPLNKKQFISMRKMTEIQPKMKKLQEKHKSNPQQMQMEVMNLYKSEGVNPLGGCLPVIIQLPFFFALFATLRSEAFQALLTVDNSRFFWITDLTVADPLKILPIAIGISTWLSQKTMPTNADPQQAKMFAFLPILMTVMSWAFPAGVLLYWAFSQVLTSLQQIYMIKKHAPVPAVEVNKTKKK